MGMHIGLIARYGTAVVEGQLAVGEEDQDSSGLGPLPQVFAWWLEPSLRLSLRAGSSLTAPGV
jgi:hypothetical protein